MGAHDGPGQIFMGAGMAAMYGFFYPEVSEATALYIATGTPPSR